MRSRSQLRHDAFDTFLVRAPRGWSDVTASLDLQDAPYTVAHQDGVGALQFSIALFTGGKVPNPTSGSLKEMLEEFGRARNYGNPTNVAVENGPLVLAAGTFHPDDKFLRVWYVTDGRNIGFITYTCLTDLVSQELRTCEIIVRGMEFRP